jgi:hypothetical protein
MILPSVGHLDLSIARGKGIRVDNGFEQGMDISFIMIQCWPN